MMYSTGLEAIDLTELRTRFPSIDGRGVNGKENVVVVIDTGVGTSSPLPTNLAGKLLNRGLDFYNAATTGTATDPGPNLAYDDNGHGTAMASIIAGAQFTNSSVVYEGVAPGVKILPLKLLANSGGNFVLPTDTARIYDAFKWILDNANTSTYNIVAVNVSWGISVYPPFDYTTAIPTRGGKTIQSIVRDVKDAGIFVAQATANTNDSQEQQPASAGDTYGVGSLNSNGDGIWMNSGGQGTTYGNDADYIDILAPGYTVVPHQSNGTYYPTFGHTSYATPHVTAAAALLKQINPDFTVDEIGKILIGSTMTVFPDTRPGAFSQEALDLDNAVEAALTATSSGGVALNPLGIQGTTNDLQYDAAGNLHAVWYNESARAIVYAKRPAGSPTFGTFEVVDAGRAASSVVSKDVGSFLDLTLDNNGLPAVAYYDKTNGNLRYAIRTGTNAWTVHNTASTGDVGSYSSLKFSAQNRPWMAHYNATNQNAMMTFYDAVSGWVTETADATTGTGTFPSIGVSGASQFVISYVKPRVVGVSSTEIRTATRTGTNTWSIGTYTNASIANSTLGQTSLSFNGSLTALSFYNATANAIQTATETGTGTTWGTAQSSAGPSYSDLRGPTSFGGFVTNISTVYYDPAAQAVKVWRATTPSTVTVVPTAAAHVKGAIFIDNSPPSPQAPIKKIAYSYRTTALGTPKRIQFGDTQWQ
ncbi:MAG TPA: S8 family serine peptidase [Tepidisphaeraceae bacterium]|nr:S8 family serine peptidase [Tepidisphaeraceae bacterium]